MFLCQKLEEAEMANLVFQDLMLKFRPKIQVEMKSLKQAATAKAGSAPTGFRWSLSACIMPL